MAIHEPRSCPNCGELVVFSRKRLRFYCSECELSFDPSSAVLDPQTIFLSYAHKSERDEDFDVSEELVLLIKAELDRDGHTVWIDKEGIRAGGEWREHITDAILGHTHFLSFLSRRSVRDPGVCLNEIATALDNTRHLQTVLVQAESEVRAPLTISHLQWHDFQDWREIRAGSKTGRNGESWDAWFAQRMALLRDAVSNVQNARVSGELQRLRDILVPSGFEARIVEKTQGFYGRQWLFDATQTWLDDSTSRMFWLKGSPGIGKSAFAAKLAHQARSAVIGFFMCDFQGRKDPEESAREAICTLAFQMASRLPDYRLKLLYQQQVDKEKVQKKSADDLFEYLITEPLNKSGKIPEATRLCLVIDGLDEAGRGDGGNALAELLAKHAERLPEWLGIIVTSRPEPYLEQILKPLSGISVDGQTERNRQDLADWIEQRLPATLQGEDRQRVVEAVLEKSGGTFLYLSLVEKDKTLNLADPKNLPDKLDGFFKQTFNRYFPDPEQYGKKTEPFLRLMAAAPGPLPAEMGRQILNWGQRELTLNVIEPMGSLLQEREGGLAFFHASLGDWLQDPSRSGTSCVEADGPEMLAEFLWGQFLTLHSSRWRDEVTHWLPLLLPHTGHWGLAEDVETFCIYLDEDSRFRPALEFARRHLELLRQQPEVHRRDLAAALHRIGLIQGKLFRPEESRETLLQALQLLDENDPALLCDIHDAIGVTFKAQARLRDSAEAFERSLEVKTRSPVIPLASRARSLDLLGDVTDAMGNFQGARDRFEEALALHAAGGGFSLANADGAALLNNLAIVTLRLHRGLVFGRGNPFVSRSREFLAAERMLRMARRLVDTGDRFAPRSDFLAYTNNLAIALHGMGEPNQALELLQDLVDRFLRFRGEDNPDLAIVLNNMGAVLDTSGDTRGSRQAYNRAVWILDRGDRSGNPHLARCLNNLGALFFSECAFEEAKVHWVEAQRILQGVLGDGHIDTAQCKSNLAAIDFLQGRSAEAVERLQDVLAVRDCELGTDHPQSCSTRISLGRALLVIGETQAGTKMIANGLQSLMRILGASHTTVQTLATRHGEANVKTSIQETFESGQDTSLRIEHLLDGVDDAFRNISKAIPSNIGADGSYRMQLEVVDILFNHVLLERSGNGLDR